MKLIKKFIKFLNQNKMQRDKLQLLINAESSLKTRICESVDNAECAMRIASVQKAIDFEIDDLLKDHPAVKAVKTKSKDITSKKSFKETPKKKTKVEKSEVEEIREEITEENTLEAISEVTETTETTNEVVENAVTEEKPVETPTINVRLLYPCAVKDSKSKKRNLRIDGLDKYFPAYANEKDKADNDNKYPTVEELDDILTEAWDMGCTGSSNKEINDYLVEKIGKYYKDLYKKHGDWYPVSNTLTKAISIIKSALGEHSKDPNVMVTKPYPTEGGTELILEATTDVSYIEEPEPKEEKKEEPKQSKKDKNNKPDKKPAEETASTEMETIQEPQDEQQQEEEIVAETVTTVDEITDETVEETVETTESKQSEESTTAETESDNEDYAVPPPVNSFESFNELEEAIYDTLNNANLKQKGKSATEQKTIRVQAREEVKLQISAWYEDYPAAKWALKAEDGSWSKEFLNYFNGISKICSENYSK